MSSRCCGLLPSSSATRRATVATMSSRSSLKPKIAGSPGRVRLAFHWGSRIGRSLRNRSISDGLEIARELPIRHGGARFFDLPRAGAEVVIDEGLAEQHARGLAGFEARDGLVERAGERAARAPRVALA